MKPDDIYNEDYEAKQREADEQLNECDPFDNGYDWDDDEDQTPDCWGCGSCGQTYLNRPMGGRCVSCYGMVEEEYL